MKKIHALAIGSFVAFISGGSPLLAQQLNVICPMQQAAGVFTQRTDTR